MALVLLQMLIYDPFEYLLFQDISGKYTWGFQAIPYGHVIAIYFFSKCYFIF